MVAALMGALMVLAPAFAASTEGLLLLQGFQTIVIFGITALVGVWYAERTNPILTMSLHRGIRWQSALLIALLVVVSQPAVTGINEWNQSLQLPSFLASLEAQMKAMEESAHQLTERFLHTSSPVMLLVNIFIMAFLPALCEEMMFRGWLQRRLSVSVNIHVAIWTSAFIFSAIHFQFYGFVPRMLLGGIFGYIYYYTRSLWAPVLAHFTNNALAVICTYATYNHLTTINFEHFEWHIILLSVLLTSVIWWQIYIKNTTNY